MAARREPIHAPRIVVVGVSGSGKTTLARALSQRFGIPHVELDALHWEPNWTMAATELFRTRVATAAAHHTWVIDGNYSKARDLIWPRATTLVWLDYPLWLILARLVRRTARRVVSRELLWGTNRERLADVLSRDSLFLWALNSQPRQRRDYPRLLSSPELAHLQVIRLRSPRETAAWLASGWLPA